MYLQYVLSGWLSLMVLTGCAMHRGEQEMSDESVNMALETIAMMDHSGFMYARGVDLGDPLLMAYAAEIRAGAVGSWEFDQPENSGILSGAAMMKDAQYLAEGDVIATKAIQRILDRKPRGRKSGALIRTLKVEPGAVYTASYEFQPDYPAVVYVEGDEQGRFGVSVRDQDGMPVCHQQNPKPRKICRWSPDDLSTYNLELENQTLSPQEFLVITN